jgi:uncharacterized membrane protein YgdD (TMEM256/DUF423 family)
MRFWLCIGAANGFMAVAMGAFAAHSLAGEAQQSARGWVETGATYQMFHALALLAVGVLCGEASAAAARRWLAAAGWCFLAGLLLFSGGLYVMAFVGLSSMGPVVPIGGLAFFAGWAALFFAGLRYSPGAGSRPS